MALLRLRCWPSPCGNSRSLRHALQWHVKVTHRSRVGVRDLHAVARRAFVRQRYTDIVLPACTNCPHL
jgi:hypothetical protein